LKYSIIATVFPLVFLGELPDKTMFASLVLASRGRPLAVWGGAATAFAVHVVIAVSVGTALFALLPHRAVTAVVAAAFAAGAVYSWKTRNEEEAPEATGAMGRSGWRTLLTAGGVIFLAEWGDLTQIITADLAARFHTPLVVGAAALAALWVVAALAVIAGRGVLRVVSVRSLRLTTAAVLLGLAGYQAALAAGA
jgi:putative Ca2+/H+ antiporter (TMEM165/GDT1 family)